MLRLLHAADLHLSEAEREYGLAVFAELIGTAQRERADYLIFCGDLFNTFPDAEKLRADFRRILGTPGFEFLYLPGNHEDLQRGQGDLARLDLGAARVLDGKPFSLTRSDRGGTEVEFFAVPHQPDYSGYGNWQVTHKRAARRIAMAHGVAAGMAYQGPDEEGGGAALDPDLFARFQCDYAALGHIHGRRAQAFGACRLAYPGSTRVWRHGEAGPRGALLLELPASGPLPEPAFVPMASAGEFRRYALPLSLEGEAPDLDSLARAWGPADHVELEFAGIVEDEKAVARLEEGLRARYGSKVRRFAVDRERVSALPGIASQPMVRKFLDAWSARKPADGDAQAREVWMRARELALHSLKAVLEGRA